MTRQCIRAIVRGRVQGVFFRASTQHQAMRLNISGYAKNLSDGSVEVIACGQADDLDTLVDWLHQGPEYARVESVRVEPFAAQVWSDFSIF